MKDCDIRKSHISSKLHMIYIYLLIIWDTLLLRLSLHLTTLHATTLHSASIHLSTLHFLSFKHHPPTLHLTPFKFPTSRFQLTSLHFTSLHFTVLLEDFRPLQFLLFHSVYNCFPNSSSKNLRIKRESFNSSVGSWFQFLMVLFTNEYFPISVLCFLSLIIRTWSTLLK